jgi:hypothetical protein
MTRLLSLATNVRYGLLLTACLVLGTFQQAAAITISAPSVTLERNQAGQLLPIVIQGTEDIAGMSFAVQIADGGPGPITQGLIDGPDITSVDLLTGAIFGSNNQGVDDPGSYPQFAQRSLITNPNTTITLTGQPAVLATLTLSTVGVAPGTYAVILGSIPPALASTEFYNAAGDPIIPTIVNGSVTIVPEPSSMVLGAFSAVGFLVMYTRRRTQWCVCRAKV